MIWQSPWFFAFLFLLLGAAFFTLVAGRKKWGALPLSLLSVAQQAPRGFRFHFKSVPEILKYLSLILVVVALARPQKADQKVQKNVQGIDIIMVLDISHSMLIEDMKPDSNRLASAKRTIREFMEKRISDRLGLVVFSGESYTRVPLTLDYDLLKENLKAVQTSNNIKLGTAIGVALANATARLKDSSATSKVVVLLTDGENNTGLIDPQTALKIAKGYGIRIYTIGVGRDGQARIPIYTQNIFGRKVKTFQPIHSKINEELLKKLAHETGGQFYRATNGQVLQGVFSKIDQLEKSDIEENRYVKYSEIFFKPLSWAIGLYLLSLFLQVTFLRRGV